MANRTPTPIFARSLDSYILMKRSIQTNIFPSYLWLLVLVCLVPWTSSLAQNAADSLPVIDYANPQDYEIGQISVVGNSYSDPNALIGVSGLRVGEVITIPGRQIHDAIRTIYNLSLFTDVQIVATKIIDKVAFLEIRVAERPRYLTHSYRGVKKALHEDLNKIVEKHIRRSSILTENAKRNLQNGMKNYFQEKGYPDAEIEIIEQPFSESSNAVKLVFDIDRQQRVKIKRITFLDNAQTSMKDLNRKLKDRKLRKKMKNTKERRRLFTKSSFVKSDYKLDKDAVIQYYHSLGLRDAQVVHDTVYRGRDGHLRIDITMDEGRQYYFRNIKWIGNTIYPDVTLGTVLGIKRGEVYNPELLEKQLRFSQDSRDVSSLYLDEGYLFFQVDAVEVAVVGDSVDLEMRIYEGPQATIDKVEINGNDRTHEHVVRRAIRTEPGEKFSRSDIIRSQREIMNLGYFDPEQMNLSTPVNEAQGTVDIIYDLVERPNDQLELSAGWSGAAGVLGTIGVTFNNFSTRRMLQKGAWRPVPMGDGQKLSLRAQSNGSYYRSLNFSFTEPWFGGKRPNSFSIGGFITTQALGGFNYSSYDYEYVRRVNKRSIDYSELRALAAYVGFGSRLRFPDDYFFINLNAYFQNYKLTQNIVDPTRSRATFSFEGRPIYTGSFNNYYLGITFGRSSINEPLFPTRGSKFSIEAKLTPPYSLFRKDNFWKLSDEQAADVIAKENNQRQFFNLGRLSELGEETVIFNAETSERFNYLEYHKWRITGEWFNPIAGKLVLRSAVKMGFLGYYNKSMGISPFERFQLGGDGLSNQFTGIQGLDIIRLRGYEVSDIKDRDGDGLADNTQEAIIFNKYELELRYPISTNPNSTIYIQGFLEGGNAFTSFSEYQPFDLKRSAGLGLRVFLPVFGLIGFDYGWGFDKPYLTSANAGIGQYAKFGLVIGFEPE